MLLLLLLLTVAAPDEWPWPEDEQPVIACLDYSSRA